MAVRTSPTTSTGVFRIDIFCLCAHCRKPLAKGDTVTETIWHDYDGDITDHSISHASCHANAIEEARLYEIVLFHKNVRGHMMPRYVRYEVIDRHCYTTDLQITPECKTKIDAIASPLNLLEPVPCPLDLFKKAVEAGALDQDYNQRCLERNTYEAWR